MVWKFDRGGCPNTRVFAYHRPRNPQKGGLTPRTPHVNPKCRILRALSREASWHCPSKLSSMSSRSPPICWAGCTLQHDFWDPDGRGPPEPQIRRSADSPPWPQSRKLAFMGWHGSSTDSLGPRAFASQWDHFRTILYYNLHSRYMVSGCSPKSVTEERKHQKLRTIDDDTRVTLR